MEREKMRERETSEEGNNTKVDEGEIGDGEEEEEEEVEGNEEGKMVIGKEIMEAFSDKLLNPFGSPITRATLQMMPQYIGKTITQEDLAREAMRRIQIEGKNIDALRHALQLKDSYGHGAGFHIAVLVLVYNATGRRVERIDDKRDWQGWVYKEQPPTSFENGQWIAFLYSKGNGTNGAQGARVFRATDIRGNVRDLLVSWYIHWRPRWRNTAYTEVRARNHFAGVWNYVRQNLERSSMVSKDAFGDLNTTVSIGGVRTSECIAYLQHSFPHWS